MSSGIVVSTGSDRSVLSKSEKSVSGASEASLMIGVWGSVVSSFKTSKIGLWFGSWLEVDRKASVVVVVTV